MTKPGSFLIFYKSVIPMLVLVAVLTVIMPRHGEFGYSYKKGDVWQYETLRAPFDFPVLKTPEQIAEEKARQEAAPAVPYYKYDYDVWNTLSSYVRKMDVDSSEMFVSRLLSAVLPYYERGVLPLEVETVDGGNVSEVVYVQKDKKATKTPRAELYNVKQLRIAASDALCECFGAASADSLLTYGGLSNLLTSNLVFDRQTTTLAHNETVQDISPTMGVFKAGAIIVSQDEVITADKVQILDSYKAEYNENVGFSGPQYFLWLGNFFYALILSSLLYFLMWFSRREIFDSMNNYLFVLTLFLLVNIVTFSVSKLPTEILYIVPYPVFALYTMAFFRKRLVLPFYTIMMLPLVSYSHGGVAPFFLLFLVGGYVAVAAFAKFGRGWKQFLAALIVFAAMLVVYFTSKFLVGVDLVSIPDVLLIFLSSIFCVLAYPLIYLFERIFNLVSVNRLGELSDTNTPLLRELSTKAPGTFQHSLAVMNMVEAAGRSIDADVPLLRAGALYHDVGKILRPENYVENVPNGGDDVYKDKPLKECAQSIILHVPEGVALAEKYNLPHILSEFISTHHGTTPTVYFYNKYLNEGGDPDDVSEFFYPGPKPSSREQVILMLCDSIEAASRTLADYSPETVSKLVDKIYRMKFSDGQFDNADITLCELDTIKEAIKEHLVLNHHTRIPYPARKNSKIKQK